MNTQKMFYSLEARICISKENLWGQWFDFFYEVVNPFKWDMKCFRPEIFPSLPIAPSEMGLWDYSKSCKTCTGTSWSYMKHKVHWATLHWHAKDILEKSQRTKTMTTHLKALKDKSKQEKRELKLPKDERVSKDSRRYRSKVHGVHNNTS